LEVVLRDAASTGSYSTSVEHSISSGSTTKAIGNNGGTETKQAQSFLLTRAGGIVGVSIRLGSRTGTPLGNLACRLDTDNSGAPSGTLVGSGANLAKGSIETPSDNAWNDIWFTHPSYLAANTLTWLVAEIPAQSGYYASPSENHLSWTQDPDAGYANGSQSTYTGSWAASTNDFQFKIHIADEGGPLRIRYAAMPGEATDADDLLEIPMYAERALMYLCLKMAITKRPGTETQQNYYESLYQGEMDVIRRQVRQRNRSGYKVIRDETATFFPYRVRRSRPSGAQRLRYES